MTFTTGSDERDAMLRRAIGECVACHDEPNFGLVVEKLPADFDLDTDELQGMLADMRGAAPPQTHMGLIEEFAESHPGGVKELPEPPESEIELHVPPTPENVRRIVRDINEREARAQLDAANAALDKARDKMVSAQVNLRHKRENFNGAVLQWQMMAESATDGLSAEARRQIEVRNHLASTAAERAARRAPHGSATAFVQRHMQNGPNRGAYSRTAAARAGYRNYDPRRGPVKLPSER